MSTNALKTHSVMWTRTFLGHTESKSRMIITEKHPDWSIVDFFYSTNADRMVFGCYNMCMFDELERVDRDFTPATIEETVICPNPLLPSAGLVMKMMNLMASHATYGDQNWAAELLKKDRKDPVIHVDKNGYRFP